MAGVPRFDNADTRYNRDDTYGNVFHKVRVCTAASTVYQCPKSPPLGRLIVYADPGNTGTIYLGNDKNVTVTTGTKPGAPLAPGDSLDWPLSQSDKLWVIAATAGDILILFGAAD